MSIFKKFKPFASPKKFVFKDPDSQREFTGTSMSDLIRQVESYRKANELEPLEYAETVITNYLCHLPVHAGSCEPLKNHKRSVVQYIKGGIALLQNIAYKDFVPQETADARSEVCKDCPHNSFPNQNHFPKWADSMAEKSIGKLRSKNHSSLGMCEICSCNMRAKVWKTGKIKLAPKELKEMKALNNPKCWQPEFAE